MEAAPHDQTFQDGIGGRCVFQAIHGRPESGKTQFVVWKLEPVPHIFLDIVCLLKAVLFDS
jgi:hypothetical protein